MRRLVIILHFTTAAAQPMPKDFEFPPPATTPPNAIVITDERFGGPKNVRYKRVPQQQPSPAKDIPPRPSAPASENCDDYLTSPKGSWSAHSEQALRQRCLDRRAGVSTARPAATTPQRPATPHYCRPNALGGMTCDPY